MHCLLAEARALVQGILDGLSTQADSGSVDVLICTPYPLLFPMAKAVAGTPIQLGAQNCHEAGKGAFTGEVSVSMLADTGCSHVIVGHSERRHVFGESAERLSAKVSAVVEAGLTVVYCVGETLEEREAGRTEDVVRGQLADAISPRIPAARLVIAYEPVWAIGTGRNATPEQAQEVHAVIRGRLVDVYGLDSAAGIRILYGGSVKPGNAARLLARQDVDGALVGGASLVADDFLGIISASCVLAAQ